MPPDICIENPVISGTSQYFIQHQILDLRLWFAISVTEKYLILMIKMTSHFSPHKFCLTFFTDTNCFRMDSWQCGHARIPQRDLFFLPTRREQNCIGVCILQRTVQERLGARRWCDHLLVCDRSRR